MSSMTIPGVPVGGLKTVGQIVGTNNLVFRTDQNGLVIAVELLSSHTPGGAGRGPQGGLCRLHQ
jgi:hypothetical protein